MRAQLQYRLPQTPELLTICLAIVCVSFSPSSPFPASRCLYLSWTPRCGRIAGGVLADPEVPITCLGHGDGRLRACTALGRGKTRQLGAPPMALENRGHPTLPRAPPGPRCAPGSRPQSRCAKPRGPRGSSGVPLRAEKPLPGRGKPRSTARRVWGRSGNLPVSPHPPQPAAPTRVVTKPPEFALSFQFRALESLHVSCVYLLIPTASEKKNRLFFFLLNFWTLIEDKWQMVFIKIPLLFPPPPALGVFRQTVQTSGDAHVQKHSIFLRSVTRSYRLSRALFPGANFGDTAVPRTSPLRPVL